MQELVQLLDHAQGETSQPSEVKKALLRVQNELTRQLFVGQSSESVESALTSIWKFFLFAGANSPTSLKTTVYRAAGSFLLKLTPYYPVEIRKTFSETITVLAKGSALVACSFAFISSTISQPYLDQFLDSVSVHHNFLISDPTFQEHLVPIISHLGRLNINWYRTMLCKFLPIVVSTPERSLMKAITALVHHYPLELMETLLNFVRGQENPASYLGLIAFILAARKFSIEPFDLFDIAKLAVGVLGKMDGASLTDVDASLQILAVESPSFNVEVIGIDDDNVKITLTGGNMITEVDEIVWNLAHYRSRPSLYCLRLPAQYVVPKYEKDGPLTLNAKFLAMSAMVNRDPSAAAGFLEILEDHVTGKYSEIVSAGIRGMSRCLPALLANCNKMRVVKLIKEVVFSSGSSWLNSVDVLRLIKAIPITEYMDFFGRVGLRNLFNNVTEWCISGNEKLATKATKTLIKMASEQYFEGVTTCVAQKIDPFERTAYTKLLEIMCQILEIYSDFETAHLCSLVLVVLESCDMYAEDLEVLSRIFEFLGHFELTFADEDLLCKCQAMALAIISGSLKIFSGESWSELVEQPASMQKAVAMLDDEIKKGNLDLLVEDNFGYSTCYRPCRTAAMFISACPPKALDKASVVQLCKRLIYLFPYETVRIMQTYWGLLPQADKAILLEMGGRRLKYSQNYEITARLCALFMECCEECRDKIGATKADLLGFARFALADKEMNRLTPRQETIFLSFLYFSDKQNFTRDQEFEMRVMKYCPDLCASVLGKKIDPANVKLKRPAAFSLPNDITVTLVDSLQLSSARQIGDSVIKAQLRQNCYDFDKSTLQKLFTYYCDTEDHSGIFAVLKYSVTRKMLISIDDNVIPSESATVVLKYLKNMNSPELETLTERYLANSSNKDIICAAIAVDPGKFLSDLFSEHKVSKTMLERLAFASLSVPFEHDEFQDTVMKCLKITKSKKKLNYVLATVANMLSISQSVSEELIDAVLKFCSERNDDLSPMVVAYCLHNLAPLVQNETQIGAIESHYALFPSVSPMTARVLQALAKNEHAKSLFEREVTKLASELFNKKRPSMFCAGVRLFAAGVANLSEKRVQTLMSECFKKFLQNYPKCVDYSGIPEATGRAWMAVLSMPFLKRYYPAIVSASEQVIPMPCQACFPSLSLCVTQIIELTTGIKEFSHVRKAMITRVRALLTRPSCVFLSKIYLMVVAVIAERTSNEQEREKYVLNLVKTWLKSGLAQRDSYGIGDIVYEWCATLSRYTGFSHLLRVLTQEIFKRCNRFFPVFVGVARFIKKFAVSHDSGQLEQIRTELLNVSTPMEKACKAHAMALRLLAGNNGMKTALDLAQFDHDCPESDKILTGLTQSPAPTVTDELIDLSPITEVQPPPKTNPAPFLFEEIIVNPAPAQSPPGDFFEELFPDKTKSQDDLFEPAMSGSFLFEAIPMFEEIPRDSAGGSDCSDIFEAITPRGDPRDLDLFETIPSNDDSDPFEAIPQEPDEPSAGRLGDLISPEPQSVIELLDLVQKQDTPVAQATPPRLPRNDSDLLDFGL